MSAPTENRTPDRVIELLLGHRTIRKYADVELPDEDVERAVRAAQMASSSSNVQAYSILRIRDPKTREQLADWSGGQEQVARAGAFFVISGDQRRHRNLAKRQGRAYAPNLETFLVAVIDASLFAQNLCVGFEAMGYGICYIGGLRTRLEQVDQLLGLPQDVLPLFGLCVGVPSQNPEDRPSLRPRLPLGAILAEERYLSDEEMNAKIDEYDKTMRSYYDQRGQAGYDWSSAIARKFEERRRPELLEFYLQKGACIE